MTKSFDDILDRSVKFGDSQRVCFEKGFEAGAQSKQAEVDELQLKLSEDSRVLHNVIDIERRKCEELQKRIDEALHEADESCGVSVDAFVKLNKILKGDTNDH